MVFHDQAVDISDNIQKLDHELSYLGIKNHCIHTGPIIRQEEDYRKMEIELRRRILNKFLAFVRGIDIQYASVSIEKTKNCDLDSNCLSLKRQLSSFVDSHRNYFSKYDIVKVYYDNGQIELTRLLSVIFSSLLPTVEFRKVSPEDYKLFQVADLICAMKLTTLRLESQAFTGSEIRFFHNGRDFRKNYLKPLQRKELAS